MPRKEAIVKRCFGALLSELPVAEALSFLDRTDRERFLIVMGLFCGRTVVQRNNLHIDDWVE